MSDNPVKEIENKLYSICYLILKNITNNVDIEISLTKENTNKEDVLKEIRNLLDCNKKYFENGDFSVEIKEGTGKKRLPFCFITPVVMELVKTSTRYVNMWVGNGQTNVSVRAPEFSLTKKIVQIFNGARKQLLKNEANIIVIDFNRFLGKFDDFCKIVATQFKPNKNTRCSGILLLEHFINNALEKAKLSYGATFVHNIHASKPVSKEFAFKIATLGRY